MHSQQLMDQLPPDHALMLPLLLRMPLWLLSLLLLLLLLLQRLPGHHQLQAPPLQPLLPLLQFRLQVLVAEALQRLVLVAPRHAAAGSPVA